REAARPARARARAARAQAPATLPPGRPLPRQRGRDTPWSSSAGYPSCPPVRTVRAGLVERLTPVGARSGDCRTDTQVCRTGVDRLDEVAGHPGGDPGRVGGETADVVG